MRNKLFSILLVLVPLTFTAAVSAQLCLPPPSGMVSWWAGDGNANDIQGTNHGTASGGVTYPSGKVGEAFSFDGTGSVDVPNAANLTPGTSDFTVDFWMNSNSVPSVAEYFLTKRNFCGFASFYSIQMQSSGTVTAELGDGGNYTAIFGTAVVNDGLWHHIALVRQSATGTLYIDGVMNASGSTSGTANISDSADVLFANSPCVPGNGTQLYKGLLDEVEYFNRALSASEVSAIFGAGSAGKCKTATPTAVAGTNQTIGVGQTVHLDGSGSFAPDTTTASLGYAWSFVSVPIQSTTTLNGANTAMPSFVADAPGTFVVQLIVSDPVSGQSSAPSQVSISSLWTAPTANAGSAQSGVVGQTLMLTGSGTDPNGLPISYAWTVVNAPSGSVAALSGANTATPHITPDIAGAYTVGLIVSDQFGSSAQSTVTISVITAASYAEQQLGNAINYVSSMPTSHFAAPGHRHSFTNLIQQVIADIQAGKLAQAKQHLNSAIIRTDGYPLRGKLDGPGPSMDWITDPTDQGILYQDLTNALGVLP